MKALHDPQLRYFQKQRIAEGPLQLVGRRVTIRWATDKAWHPGTIKSYANGEETLNSRHCGMSQDITQLNTIMESLLLLTLHDANFKLFNVTNSWLLLEESVFNV